MRSVLMACSLIALAACGEPQPATEMGEPSATGEQMWVSDETADRRTCPSDECGLVGRLRFRESARVYERQGEWARVSERYDASCVGGRSEHVEEGSAACDEANGIVEGRFAEWVPLSALSATRPADPAETATDAEQLVAGSDDFARYRDVFSTSAARLIADGTCSERDFTEVGGWMKSVNEHRDEPVYFMYCGGMTTAHRIYLDARTGRTFR